MYYQQESYIQLSKRCLIIVKTKSPEESIKIISSMKLSDGTVIGKEFALKIYKSFSDKIIPYDSLKYENNISEYKKLIRRKIDRATKAAFL